MQRAPIGCPWHSEEQERQCTCSASLYSNKNVSTCLAPCVYPTVSGGNLVLGAEHAVTNPVTASQTLRCDPQVGDVVPDVAPAALRGMWDATQALLRQRKIAAGHDVSDGGLAVALLEMAFAGNCGVDVELPAPGEGGAFAALFAEEPGLVLEVRWLGLVLCHRPSPASAAKGTGDCNASHFRDDSIAGCAGSLRCTLGALQPMLMIHAYRCRKLLIASPCAKQLSPLHQVATEDVAMVLDSYAAAGVGASVVGSVTQEPRVSIAVGDAGQACIAGPTAQLRDAWEATSFQLERLQVAPDVGSEALTLYCVLVAPSQARPLVSGCAFVCWQSPPGAKVCLCA